MCCFLAGGPPEDLPSDDSFGRRSEKGSLDVRSAPSSETLRSSSAYMIPFCTKLMSWPGGILAPLMLLLATELSAPKVNAECRNPARERPRPENSSRCEGGQGLDPLAWLVWIINVAHLIRAGIGRPENSARQM